MGIIFYVELDGVIFYWAHSRYGSFRPTLSHSRGLSENEDFSKTTTESNRVYVSIPKTNPLITGPIMLIVVAVKFIGRKFLFVFPELPLQCKNVHFFFSKTG